MNERPDQNLTPQPPRATGSFKVNIDEGELAPMPSRRRAMAPPPTRAQQQSLYTEAPATNRAYLTEKERKQEKRAHRKRNRIKARKNKRIFAFMWLCMVLLVSFTLASYLIGGSNDFFAVGRTQGTAQVTIPEGLKDADQLAQLLSTSGIINKPEFFSLYCKVKKEDMADFVVGDFTLRTDMDYEDIINTLQDSGSNLGEEVTVTIPEGRNALEVAALMEENEVCTAKDFLAALNEMDFTNYQVIADMGGGNRYYKLEGYLFPDTYNFYKGEELESVIGKMLNNFQNRISDQIYSMAEQRGMTLDQVVTMASIIQAEAADVSDMFNVSAVLHNRLDYGAQYDIYRLECDSTMAYPYRRPEDVPGSGALPHGGYSTYEIEGLPPGAICNPGAEAILAAVRPNEENYLYFCHSAEGVAYYASSSWEHEQNLVLAGLREGY